MILTIRTDKPEAEIGLYNDSKQLNYIKWPADRQLSRDIHKKVSELLQGDSLQSLSGVIFYAGPGSFTGLRIGASVVNTLSHELDKPIVKASGENWIKQGLKELEQNPESRFVVPDYGRPARITLPRK